MEINFVSSKVSDEICITHTKSDNIDILMGSETNEIVKELFKSILQKYQEGLAESMIGSVFIFDSVSLLYYYLQLKEPKKTTRDPKNSDNNCFQYTLIVALNYHNIKKDPQRILKVKPFICQYDWTEIDFPLDQKDWKKSELNNKTIALNILFLPYNTEKIRLAYKSEHNFKRENQVILPMITDSKKWNYLTVKKLSSWLRGITSKHKEDFYCLSCFHSYSTK